MMCTKGMFETCLSVTCFFKIEALERKSFFGNVSYWVYSSTSSSTSSTSSIQSTVAPQVDLEDLNKEKIKKLAHHA